MTGPRSTSADVARRAGVSRATVSYVLNDAPRQTIPEATRQRVLAAARELDYTPHAAARALRAGTSRLVLLVNQGVPYGTNLSVLIEALAAEVAAGGRSLVVWQQNDPAELSATLAHLQPVVVIALGRLDSGQTELLARSRIPCVEGGAGGRDPVDHGAVLQVRHLAERGHRMIGCLTTGDSQLAMFAGPRLDAIRRTCAELGLPAPPVARLPGPAELSIDALAAELDAWTRRAEPVTAVACYNDVLAAACLAAAADAGIDVPGRLAVVGLDDEAMSRFTRPALSTVRLPMADYARHLWRLAAAALAKKSPADADSDAPSDSTADSEAVPVRLIERAST